MFIVCVLDVSPWLQAPTTLGLSLLECAKCGMEELVEDRRRQGQAMRDQYMLVLTSASPFPSSSSSSSSALFPQHAQVVCGWHDSNKFLSALKSVTAPAVSASSPPPSPSLSYLSTAIGAALDLLNKYSRPNGIDNWGRGRVPWYSEPATVLLFTAERGAGSNSVFNTEQTDGDSRSGEWEEWEWTASSVPGSQLSKTSFRWDQRIVPVILRLPLRPPAASTAPPSSSLSSASSASSSVPPAAPAPSSPVPYQSASSSALRHYPRPVSDAAASLPPSPLSAYLTPPAAETGSKVLIVSSLRELLGLLDGLFPSSSPPYHVYVHLLPTPPAASLPSCYFVGVHVRGSGTWPIPEEWSGEAGTLTELPKRDSHPVLYWETRTRTPPASVLQSLSPSASSSPSSSSSSSPAAAPSLSSPASAPPAAVAAPPPLPALELSIPFDTYELDPSAAVSRMLFADGPDTCRYLYTPLPASTVASSPSSPSRAPFGLLTADRRRGKPVLLVLPWNFPTLFSILARVDVLLRGLPLTASSSVALSSAPALFASLSLFLSSLPSVYLALMQAVLGRIPRLPRLEVRDTGRAALSAEVMEMIKGWKEKAGQEMKREKEDAEKQRAKEAAAVVRAGKTRKRQRSAGDAAAAETAAGSSGKAQARRDDGQQRRPKAAWEEVVEALITGRTERKLDMLPPPPPPEQQGDGSKDGQQTTEARTAAAGGIASLRELFVMSAEEMAQQLPSWREKACRHLQRHPLHALAFPTIASAGGPEAGSSSSSSAPLLLRPRSSSTVVADSSHCVPLSGMGDYISHLRRQHSLRLPLPDAESSSFAAFGSPFRRLRGPGLRGEALRGDGEEAEDGREEEDVMERDVQLAGRPGEAAGSSRLARRAKTRLSLEQWLDRRRREGNGAAAAVDGQQAVLVDAAEAEQQPEPPAPPAAARDDDDDDWFYYLPTTCLGDCD